MSSNPDCAGNEDALEVISREDAFDTYACVGEIVVERTGTGQLKIVVSFILGIYLLLVGAANLAQHHVIFRSNDIF